MQPRWSTLAGRIAYLERTLSSSLVDAPQPESRLFASSMFASPNPSLSRVRFAYAGGAVASQGQTLDVFSVSGRKVASVTGARDGSFDWNGREASGQRAAAGVYFARIAGSTGLRPVRFTLLP